MVITKSLSEPQSNSEVEDEELESGVGVQTDETCQDIEMKALKEQNKLIPKMNVKIEHLKEENKQLTRANKVLNEELSVFILTEESLQSNDEKILYYTGLTSWDVFSKLLTYVKPHLKQRSLLTPFQQRLMTLMRLRLNLSGQDLVYRFHVHPSTVSRLFEFVERLLYSKLKPLIMWPDHRDSLNANGI